MIKFKNTNEIEDKAKDFSHTMINYAKNYSKTHSEEEYQEMINEMAMEIDAMMLMEDF